MDIRLQQEPFELDGRIYQLRCNMNVLADVQEAYGGNFSAALSGQSTLRSVLIFLAAMLNDYADEMGWPVRYTASELGRKLDPQTSAMAARNALVMKLVRSALTPEPATEGEPEKN